MSTRLRKSLGNRLLKWLRILEQTGKTQGLGESQGYYLGTPTTTVADLAVFSLLWTMRQGLPALQHFLSKAVPHCLALCDRLLDEAPSLAKYCAANPCTENYCGGQIEVCCECLHTSCCFLW